MKLPHSAGRWVFDQDRLAYYLMMAALETIDPDQRKAIIELMNEPQRKMARKAKDGTWKRF